MVSGPKYFHLMKKITSMTFVDFILYMLLDNKK